MLAEYKNVVYPCVVSKGVVTLRSSVPAPDPGFRKEGQYYIMSVPRKAVSRLFSVDFFFFIHGHVFRVVSCRDGKVDVVSESDALDAEFAEKEGFVQLSGNKSYAQFCYDDRATFLMTIDTQKQGPVPLIRWLASDARLLGKEEFEEEWAKHTYSKAGCVTPCCFVQGPGSEAEKTAIGRAASVKHEDMRAAFFEQDCLEASAGSGGRGIFTGQLMINDVVFSVEIDDDCSNLKRVTLSPTERQFAERFDGVAVGDVCRIWLKDNLGDPLSENTYVREYANGDACAAFTYFPEDQTYKIELTYR